MQCANASSSSSSPFFSSVLRRCDIELESALGTIGPGRSRLSTLDARVTEGQRELDKGANGLRYSRNKYRKREERRFRGCKSRRMNLVEKQVDSTRSLSLRSQPDLEAFLSYVSYSLKNLKFITSHDCKLRYFYLKFHFLFEMS